MTLMTFLEARGLVADMLTPAHGHNALFANEAATDYVISPLIAWALCHQVGAAPEHGQHVIGLVAYDEMGGEVDAAPFHPDFLGYVHDSEDLDEADLRERLAIIRDSRAEAEGQGHG